jgi:hypothetical protein
MRGNVAKYRNSVVDVLNPENVIVHDIFDNEPGNHHHVGDNATAMRWLDAAIGLTRRWGRTILRVVNLEI